MKNTLLFVFFLATLLCQAQLLPKDEAGKVVFEDIVKADSIKSLLLYTNGMKWITDSGYQIVSGDGSKITATQQFPVYDKGYVTKKLHGKISFSLSIEVKDGKYRYRFSDFVFAYYKEDRTYHFVPTGKKKPLEEASAQGWQKLWENHKKTTLTIIESQIKQLQTAMLVVPKPAAQKSKKEEW
jgi:hypothetical protein